MTKPLKQIPGIPVSWKDRPLDGQVHVAVMQEGKTIGEIVESLRDRLPPFFDERGSVRINGEEVPRGMWHLVRPRVGVKPIAVTLHYAPAGGGAKGKNPLAIIAAIALVVATAGIGSFGIPALGIAAGTFGAKIAAAGLALAGSLAINALTPPPAQPSPATSESTDREPAGLTGNTLQPGGPIPRVVGTMRAFPPFASEPLQEIVGDDEYVEGVMVLAGPHRLSNPRIGGVSTDRIPDLSIEMNEGLGGQQTLVTRQARTDSPQLTLSSHLVEKGGNQVFLQDQGNPLACLPQWHALTTREAPDEAWAVLAWPEGLSYASAPSTNTAVPVRLRIRPVGSPTWTNLPEVHFVSSKVGVTQKTVKLRWGMQGSFLPTPATEDAPYAAFYQALGQNEIAPSSSDWVAHSHFYAGSGDTWYASGNVATSGLRNIALYSDRVEFFLDEGTFPKGRYEIEVMRGMVYYPSNFDVTLYEYTQAVIGYNVVDFFWYQDNTVQKYIISQFGAQHKTTVSRVSSIWNETPIKNADVATIAVRVKNRRLEQISVLASGYVKDWNETTQAWDDLKVTGNPAPHYRDVLVGSQNANPMPSGLLDDEGLLSWREWCEDEGHEVNAVCEGMLANDVLTMIASAGYARPRASEKWGVIIDRDVSEEAPVQVFTPRNLGSFRFQKAFADPPHALRAKFRNRDLDYADDEILVPAPGRTLETATKFEEMVYSGLVDGEAVEARALFDQSQVIARSTFYYGEADAEAIVCTRGSLVAVQHDILSRQAGFARIKEVIRDDVDPDLVLGLVLDAKVPAKSGEFFANPEFFAEPEFFSDQQFGIAVRLHGGGVATKPVVAGAQETDEIEFATPYDDPDGEMIPTQLIATGPLGSEFLRLKVQDVTPRKNLTYGLTMVDEAPELFAA